MIFTPFQKRLIGITATFAISVAFVSLIVLVVYVFGQLLSFFSDLLWPLAVAGILALILQPTVDFLEQRFKIGRLRSIFLLYLIAVVAVFIVMAFLLPTVVFELVQFVHSIPDILDRLFLFIQERSPEWLSLARQKLGTETLSKMYGQFLEGLKSASNLSVVALQKILSQAAHIFTLLMGLGLIPIYLFFFLRSRRGVSGNVEQLRSLLSFFNQGTQENVVYLVQEFIACIVSFFRGQILVSASLGALYALGFAFCGLPFGLVIGLGMGLLNIVPYLGTVIGLLVALPTAFFYGDDGMGLVFKVLLVFVSVQMMDALFVTPRIMGKKTGLHPLAVILSILFWGKALGGILGMILGIPLTAFLITLWRLVRRRQVVLLPAETIASPTASPQ
jgi:predicted PurR-regulated permease PerM